MDIQLSNQQNVMSLCLASVQSVVKEALLFENICCDEISLTFLENKEMCLIHDKFFDDPSPTDCMSFPIDSDLDDPHFVLGEVLVCPEVAMNYAKENKVDPYQEVTLYVVHGILHLIGYDDIDPQDREKMRERESKHLKNLAKKQLIIKPAEVENL